MRLFSTIGLGAVVAAFAFVTQATASTIHPYGDFTGPNLEYLNVTETDTPGPGPYLGSPVSPPGSDDLRFNPLGNGFAAFGQNGTSELLDAGLTVGSIQTLFPNGSIVGLTINESGTWTVCGPEGTAAASASLFAEPLFITSINGSPANIQVTPTVVFTYATTLGSASIVPPSSPATTNSVLFESDGTLIGGSGTWGAVATYDLQAALAANDDTGKKINQLQFLALDDRLQANTLQGGTAYIDKKTFAVLDPFPVPEPSALTLALLGGMSLLGLGIQVRRQWPAMALARAQSKQA